MHDVVFDILRPHRGLAIRVEDGLDQIVRFEPVANVLVASIYLTTPRLYSVTQVHFAQIWKMIEQIVLEPKLIGPLRHNYDKAFFHD